MARTKALIEAELAKEKERSKAFQADAIRAEKAYEAAAEENNRLRDNLMAATREIERWRGYFEGIEDSKPPRMIEEPRDRRGPAMHGEDMPWEINFSSSPMNTYGRERPKPWWNR